MKFSPSYCFKLHTGGLLPYGLMLALLVSGCDAIELVDGTEEEQPGQAAHVSGEVLDGRDDSALENAIVEITSPEEFEQNTVTDEQGAFQFQLEPGSTVTLTLAIRKEGFLEETLEADVEPGGELSLPAVTLQVDEEGNGPADEPDGKESGGAASIELVSVSTSSIVVKETGGEQQAIFEFQVRDSSGVPVDPAHQTEVQFNLGAAPGGGESLSPMTTQIDDDGQVSTVLTSGTESGIVQVQAVVHRDGFTVESRPTNLTIFSGPPHEDFFTMFAPDPQNITHRQTSTVEVLLGDRHGNPVPAGTSVHFRTTSGVIDGSAETNESGQASATLQFGEPLPEDEPMTVTAQTVDENNETIEKQHGALFTLPEPVIEVSPDGNFFIGEGENQSFQYTVTDPNGHPLVQGTGITVEVEGPDLEATGDTEITLGDHIESGPGTTEFSFNVRDVNEDEPEGTAEVRITITVEGPEGIEGSVTVTGQKEQ